MFGEFAFSKMREEARTPLLRSIRIALTKVNESFDELRNHLASAAEFFASQYTGTDADNWKTLCAEAIVFIDDEAYDPRNALDGPIDDAQAAWSICSQIDGYEKALSVLKHWRTREHSSDSEMFIELHQLLSEVREGLRSGLWEALLTGELQHDS